MDLTEMFFEELREKSEEAREKLKRLVEDRSDLSALNDVFRSFHTVKGSASLVGFSGFQEIFHELEDILKRWRENPESVNSKTITRILEVLDFLSNFSGDLSREDMEDVRAMLEGKEVKKRAETGFVMRDSREFKEFIEQFLDDLVELETQIRFGSIELAQITLSMMKKRLIQIHEETEYLPLKDTLSGFDSMVMKDAADMGKEVEFTMNVEGAKIEKEEAKTFRDVLLHLARNAVVHGIEDPDERERKGKKRKGKVEINAFLDGDTLVIEVKDDGRGIDFQKLEEKAKKLGIEYEDPIDLLYKPSLSTLDKSDMKGGRGVGLDAVKEYVERREGRIDVETKKDRGTVFRITLPLRRYLRSCLIVRRMNTTFALEVKDVKGIVQDWEEFYRNSVRYASHGGNIYRLEDVGKGIFRFLVLCEGVAIAADEILGVRETSIKTGNKVLDFVNGFAVGVDKFPVPVLNPIKLKTKPGRSVKRVRTLVVDDSPLTRLVMTKMLERAGFEVESAVNAEEALKILKSKTIDYAIVDLELPDMNGFDLIESIRKISPDTSIAILTTNVSEENEERARSLGVEFFVKGEDVDELLEFLRGARC